MSEKTPHPALKPATEFGPIVAFFVVYTLYGLMPATAAIMITTVVALAVSFLLTRKIPMMPLVTAVIVMIFGGLTLYLQDETFIKMKPTIIYGLFSAALLAGLAMGKSFIKVMFSNFWKIDDAGWKKLTLRLAGFSWLWRWPTNLSGEIIPPMSGSISRCSALPPQLSRFSWRRFP